MSKSGKRIELDLTPGEYRDLLEGLKDIEANLKSIAKRFKRYARSADELLEGLEEKHLTVYHVESSVAQSNLKLFNRIMEEMKYRRSDELVRMSKGSHMLLVDLVQRFQPVEDQSEDEFLSAISVVDSIDVLNLLTRDFV